MEYTHYYECHLGLYEYRRGKDLEEMKGFIRRNLMNPKSYPQFIKDSFHRVVFETRDQKEVTKEDKPKRVRSFNGLPGFECNVKKVKYVCDGKGRNPEGTELDAFVINKNDINSYLVYVPRQDKFSFTAFMQCKELSPGKYTHDKNLNGVII